MSRQSFENCVEELLMAIDCCLERSQLLAGLVLLYAGIDIMAWLNLTQSRDDLSQKGADFINWVETYLLPGTELPCKAIDLWGARCAILHTGTAESRGSRWGKAKEIYYSFGPADPNGIQNWIDHFGESDAKVAVHADSLVKAFREATQRFQQNLGNNPDKANIVYQRAAKFFVKMTDMPDLPSR